MKLNELATAIAANLEQLAKAKAEIVGKIDELQAALGSVDIPEDARVALTALNELAQAMDDIVPDAEPAPIA